MKLYIITGMSGAGKSHAMRTLEDSGYYCIDNIPPSFIPEFARLGEGTGQMENVAITVDIRGGRLLSDIYPSLEELDSMNVPYEIIFLETLDKVLVKRYQETRRQHPLETKDVSIEEAIGKERQLLSNLKKRADYILDSSGLMPRELKKELLELLYQGKEYEQIMISIVSFGFKYGTPLDCDNILDVRFIPNPYYNASMRKLTGRNETVSNYVLKQDITMGFVDKSVDLFEHILPGYISEGKNQVVLGIGCTGGRHRSVAISERISEILIERGHRVVLTHRDISKDSKR